MVMQEEMYFISLTEKKGVDNRRLVYKAPIFVAYFPGQPYFFISQNGKKDDILHVSFNTSEPSLLGRILGFLSSKDLFLIWVMSRV
jgi:hypothetical protein